MPELPEVQTIVNDLRKAVKGETVADFWSDWKKGIRNPPEKFRRGIQGKKITGVRRIGKNILLDLSGGGSVIIHLRMTGTLIVICATSPTGRQAQSTKHKKKIEKHIHHIFYFKSGKTLEFSDVRKFGNLELIDTGETIVSKGIKNLGIDALSKKLTFTEFGRILGGRKTNVKQLLMDQGRIAGIGNIYANEILYEAGISPLRKADSLGGKEKRRLYASMTRVLKRAIRLRGTSVSDYRDAGGKQGKFQKFLRVYGRAGKKCPACGKIILRVIIGQRGTFFCNVCQR